MNTISGPLLREETFRFRTEAGIPSMTTTSFERIGRSRHSRGSIGKLPLPKRPVLTGVGAEALVAARRIAEEPASAVGSSTASRVNETGDFGGETLPECGVDVTGDPANGNDPLGLCTAMLAGITMGPGDSTGSGAAFDNEQIALGAVAGFPYAGQSQPASIASVLSQAVFGPNTSTLYAVAALEDALSSNTGSIDVIAYSGGAQAFTTAFNELTPAQQARIGNILYISPGAGGQLAGTADAANTTVVLGGNGADVAATIWMTVPFGANQIETNCAHTDLGYLLQAAQAQLSQFAKDGQCTNQDIFFRHPQGTAPPMPRALPFYPLADGGSGGGLGSGPVPSPEPQPVITTTITYN